MKTFLLVGLLSLSSVTWASKSYQVTGQVKEVTATSMTVMKGKEAFEIELAGKPATDIKVGDKVTVKYSMSATDIEKKK